MSLCSPTPLGLGPTCWISDTHLAGICTAQEELKRYTAERLENSSAISKVDLQPNKKRILEELRKELE